jgi:D-tagatose-1,6-bisphosphate aldolase subunit GatZ/KbaZ
MQPAEFAALAYELAQVEDCPKDLIALGGDHLGPNPWREKPAEAAMTEAEKMVAAYVGAGFCKLHLDASMGCAGEAHALDDATTAARAARLARVAEDTAKLRDLAPPLYIIGTEVPPPGGADHALTTIKLTSPNAARQTLALHEEVFKKNGLSDAFARVIGLVVQPGVEFGNQNTIRYDRSKARPLSAILNHHKQIIFEAHSTDYQGTEPLAQLVADGFPILKVGPELTFVMREALYALDLIASDLMPDYGNRPLYTAMEALMVAQPESWNRHYGGGDAAQKTLRHYSLSDRIRYYWATEPAQTAVTHLFDILRDRKIPLPLIWQHLPQGDAFAGKPLVPEDVVIWRIMRALKAYQVACGA